LALQLGALRDAGASPGKAAEEVYERDMATIRSDLRLLRWWW
jgi:hypothetical protein